MQQHKCQTTSTKQHQHMQAVSDNKCILNPLLTPLACFRVSSVIALTRDRAIPIEGCASSFFVLFGPCFLFNLVLDFFTSASMISFSSLVIVLSIKTMARTKSKLGRNSRPETISASTTNYKSTAARTAKHETQPNNSGCTDKRVWQTLLGSPKSSIIMQSDVSIANFSHT